MCGYTTWSGLRDAAPLPHETVAVLGIGGLGHVALQLSKACGFDTVAITHSPDKHALAKQLAPIASSPPARRCGRAAARIFCW